MLFMEKENRRKMMPPISFTKVRAVYYRKRILEDVTFNVKKGEVYGLLGRNGAGKTTSMRLLTGLLKPRSGEVRLFGGDPFLDDSLTKRRFVFLGDDLEFPKSLRPADLFRLYKDAYGKWNETIARDLVDLFSIPCRSTLRSLSHGQKQQVYLTTQIAVEPELFLLDEPARGLDPVARREFITLLVDIISKRDVTMLYASNVLSDVERLAARIGFLDNGRIKLEGNKEDLASEVALLSFDYENDLKRQAEKREEVLKCRQRDGDLQMLVRIKGDKRDEAIDALGLGNPNSIKHLPLEELFIELLGK